MEPGKGKVSKQSVGVYCGRVSSLLPYCSTQISNAARFRSTLNGSQSHNAKYNCHVTD